MRDSQTIEEIEKELEASKVTSRGKSEHFVSNKRLKNYFYAHRHIHGDWSVEYAKKIIENLPKLMYVAAFHHFLKDGPTFNISPETVQYCQTYIDKAMKEPKNYSREDYIRTLAFQMIDRPQHLGETEQLCDLYINEIIRPREAFLVDTQLGIQSFIIFRRRASAA